MTLSPGAILQQAYDLIKDRFDLALRVFLVFLAVDIVQSLLTGGGSRDVPFAGLLFGLVDAWLTLGASDAAQTMAGSGVSFDQGYVYDAAGRLTRINHPGSVSVLYDYTRNHVTGVRAVVGGDAGGDALARLDGHGECGRTPRGVVLHHRRQLEPVGQLIGHRQADDPAGVADREGDQLGRHLLARNDYVALVLAVLVINNDHRLAHLALHHAQHRFQQEEGDQVQFIIGTGQKGEEARDVIKLSNS